MLTFYFSGAEGHMTESDILTSGMRGTEAKLTFSQMWMGLSKTVVFSNGIVTVDVVCAGDTVTIPAKVLEKPLKQLTVGVYGVSGDGSVVIPTVRAKGPVIQPGVDPAGDPAMDPELPVWARLQGIIGDIGELYTEDRSSLVAAINELVEYGAGEDGATFIPHVDESGNLSWSNNLGLSNPDPVNIMGPAGASSKVTMTRSEDVDGSGRSGLAVNVETPADNGMSISMTYLYDGEGIDNVSVETLEPGKSATAKLINPVGNNRTLKLGIPRGKSAYEYAQDAGFTGTEAEFAEKFAALCLADAEEVAF